MFYFKKQVFFIVFYIFCYAKIAYPYEGEAWSKNSFLIGYGGNYPILQSRDRFEYSLFHPKIGIQHMTEEWILGLSTQFKILEDSKEDESVVLWNMQQDFYRKWRLYHPFYLLIGGKFLYLMPVEKAILPFRKSDKFKTELGVGISIAFLFLYSRETGGGFYIDAWRGTATRKFQSLEIGLFAILPLQWF